MSAVHIVIITLICIVYDIYCVTIKSRPYTAVIFPGFGNDKIDYIKPFDTNIEDGMQACLSRRGIQSTVVPIKRLQWLNIIKGIVNPAFWANTCTPSDLFSFYFKEADATVREAVQSSGGPVVLIGHSAGGWLARAMLADGRWAGSNTTSSELVTGLVSLGTPHLPPKLGSFDVTRGALRYVNEYFPGAWLRDRLFYVTVAGTAVTSNSSAPRESLENFAAQSYSMVLGEDAEGEPGDGLVPLRAAHLDGARQLTLRGVFHSIDAPENRWYGGESVMDAWVNELANCVQP